MAQFATSATVPRGATTLAGAKPYACAKYFSVVARMFRLARHTKKLPNSPTIIRAIPPSQSGDLM